MVCHALMDHAHQVGRAVVGNIELEIALGVGLSSARLLHALRKIEENDFIAGARFSGRAILYRAGQCVG